MARSGYFLRNAMMACGVNLRAAVANALMVSYPATVVSVASSSASASSSSDSTAWVRDTGSRRRRSVERRGRGPAQRLAGLLFQLGELL